MVFASMFAAHAIAGSAQAHRRLPAVHLTRSHIYWHPFQWRFWCCGPYLLVRTTQKDENVSLVTLHRKARSEHDRMAYTQQHQGLWYLRKHTHLYVTILITYTNVLTR